MTVIRGFKNLKVNIKGSVIAIGVFDGVHLGHKEVITKVVGRAKLLNLKSVVITFDPHPLKALHPGSNIPSLISLKHRIRLIEKLGADILIIVKFTPSLSKLTPEEFVKRILVDKALIKEIFVSKNFYFGRGARGGVDTLKAFAEKFGFRVNVIKPLKIGGIVVSSTRIRKLISRGDIIKASRFLGRPVSVLGTVVRGLALARVLGYPTANVNPHHEVMPPEGVYAVMVRFGKSLLKGVLNIGTKPTFYGSRDREPTIETHIFDFNKRIYGKDIEILFVKKIRDELRFKNPEDLTRQIRRDKESAKAILALQSVASMLI